jgi:hypothetical protein
MENNGLKKKQDLIKEYYFKLKELNKEKNAITKTINLMKDRFEELIEVEADLDQLYLFENMNDFLKESKPKKLSVINNS